MEPGIDQSLFVVEEQSGKQQRNKNASERDE